MHSVNALALGLAAVATAASTTMMPTSNTTIVTTTKVVDSYTTYCPEATSFTMGTNTYTVHNATTLTITDCPCTIVEPCPTCPPSNNNGGGSPPSMQTQPAGSNPGSGSGAGSGTGTGSGAGGAPAGSMPAQVPQPPASSPAGAGPAPTSPMSGAESNHGAINILLAAGAAVVGVIAL